MAPTKSPRPTCGSQQSTSVSDGTSCRGASPTVGSIRSIPCSPLPVHVAQYEVRPGDSLWRIAETQLGQARLWPQLAELNGLSAPYTLQIGQALIVPDYRRCDATADYMHGEMISNANSAEVREILKAHQRARNLNAEARKYYEDAQDDEWYQAIATAFKINTAGQLDQAAAMARVEATGRWFLLVRQGGPWDHKPHLREMYAKMSNPAGSYGAMGRAYHFPVRGDVLYEYYYDIWSNIHFGYVGTKAGFDRNTLQEGASSGLPGAGTNDAGDVISTDIGIDLWQQHGLNVTKEVIQASIVANGPNYTCARQTEIGSGIPAQTATNVVISGNDYK